MIAARHLSLAGAALAAMLLATAAAAPVRAQDLPDRDQVLAVARRSALAQVEQMQAFETSATLRRHGAGVEWISAVFYTGAIKLTDTVAAPEVDDYLFATARHFNYGLQGDGVPIHMINADDQAVGDLYQSVYLRTGAPGVLLPLKANLDYTVPYLGFTPKPDKLVWWWCDALFMAPPMFTRMSAITGDPRYIQAMDAQYWRVYDHLYDRDQHLFARDTRFITRRSANGRKIFWSRGQGWVLAGLARTLEYMPADFPSRPRYVALYRQMAERLVSLQAADGLWRSSLLDEAAFPEPETSGTALNTYALAFGVNHGLLDRKTFLPAVLKGWAGLNRYVLPSGLLGQVQSAGDQPVPTRPETTTLYASGAFLLAGVEVAALGRPATPLPAALPVPPKLTYPAASWRFRPLPADATGAQRRERERGEAERATVADQAFDPMKDDPHYAPPVPLAGRKRR